MSGIEEIDAQRFSFTIDLVPEISKLFCVFLPYFYVMYLYYVKCIMYTFRTNRQSIQLDSKHLNKHFFINPIIFFIFVTFATFH